MKMAKPSAKDIAAAEELQQVLIALDQNQRWDCAALEDTPDFFQLIDDDEFDPEQGQHAQALYNKLVTLMWENPSFHNRVISGMCHVIMYEKNEIIDPESDCIDLHPRFAEMWNDLKRETQAARYWNKRYHQVVAERNDARAKLAAMEIQTPIYQTRHAGERDWHETDIGNFEICEQLSHVETRKVFLRPVPADKPDLIQAIFDASDRKAVDTFKHCPKCDHKCDKPAVAVPDRILELAARLTAPGPKCCAVSASECHEISDFISSLVDHCPSHESEQHSFGESEFIPVDLLLKPDLTDEDVERWRKQNLETKLAAVDEVITMLRRRPLPNDPFIKSGFCEAIVAVVTMRQSMNQERVGNNG